MKLAAEMVLSEFYKIYNYFFYLLIENNNYKFEYFSTYLSRKNLHKVLIVISFS